MTWDTIGALAFGGIVFALFIASIVAAMLLAWKADGEE